MIPTNAQGVYFQPCVSVCDPTFTAVPAALPYGGYMAPTVPYVPLQTECTVHSATAGSATSSAVSSPSGSATLVTPYPCIGVQRNGHGGIRHKATTSTKTPSLNSVKKTEDGKTPCQFYLRTGTCAFGARCKYYHPPNQQPPQLNREGYPVRKGEKNCPFFMKHGVCSFGATCKFNHPLLSRPRGSSAKGRSFAPPHLMPVVSADYLAWPTAVPSQGWYVSHIPPSAQPMLPPIYPPFCCYESSPLTSTMQGVYSNGASTVGSFVSSEFNSNTKDEESTGTESWEKSSDDDRCWSC